MDFSLTEEQHALQETARKYAAEKLPEVARRCEEEDEAPPHEVVREFAEMGFLGINVPGGVQRGFASLVDLRTGQVVWFNHFARGVGDLRNPDDAAAAIDLLLAGSTA